jgi:hypothetical protein
MHSSTVCLPTLRAASFTPFQNSNLLTNNHFKARGTSIAKDMSGVKFNDGFAAENKWVLITGKSFKPQSPLAIL